MQIVIDIDTATYTALSSCTEREKVNELNYYEHLIANGTPLPEHHGRLGDLDALYKEMKNGIKAGNYEDGYEDYEHINNMDDCLEAVKYAETIIPATKGDNKNATCD